MGLFLSAPLTLSIVVLLLGAHRSWEEFSCRWTKED